jgi:hypothetical protein
VDIIGNRETYKNCAAITQSETFSYSDTTTIGSRVTKTQTVANGADISIDLSFKFLGIGGQTGVKFSHTVTITDTREEDYTSQRQLSFSVPISIPAMTLLTLQRSWIRREVPVEFSGTVQLNASVSSNLEGIGSVARVIPKASDRTFAFAGVVTDAQLYDGTTVNIGQPLKASDCTTPAVTVTAEQPK